MISETGKNLSVLIVTNTDLGWQTFATWYSFFNNLPDCKIHIFCYRNESIPFEYYQWAKRLKITCTKNNVFSKECPEFINWLNAINLSEKGGFISQPVLVVRPCVMAIDVLDSVTLEKLNKQNILANEDAWFFKDTNVEQIFNNCALNESEICISETQICYEAKEFADPKSIVCYRKGCGRWIDTAKGCPFSNAGGLVTTEMTANEIKIIDLWKKMVPLYHAVV